MHLPSTIIVKNRLFAACLILSIHFLAVAAFAQDEAYVDNYKTWSLNDYEAEADTAIESFNEAPELTELVEAGELPPIDERLPLREDVLVVQPRREIGSYGGQLTYHAMNPESFGNTGWTAWDQNIMGASTDVTEFFPQIAKTVELSEDLRTVTFTLRRGMKWSDGEPVTTEDVMFWYEDIMLNEELPSLPGDLVPNGEPVVIDAPTDNTVTLTFEEPYPVIMTVLHNIFPFAPKHYLQQFHVDYNDEAPELAREAGFETWADYFVDRYSGQTGDEQVNPDLPILKPWTLARIDQFGNKFYLRNPYYWKVDTAGNQLPYVNNQVRLLLADAEVIKLNIQAGEIDYTSAGFGFDLPDLPVLSAAEAAGDYTTLLWPQQTGASWKYSFNLTTNDPVLREIFNDVRFRQAMSLAIDRNEINETLFLGLGVSRQWGPPQSDVFFQDWMLDYYATHDVDEANRLLDEMGLEWDANRQFRLRPDGERLTIILWDAIEQPQQDSLVKDYWEAVGVSVQINPTSREAFAQAALANELQASVWWGTWNDELKLYQIPIWFRPPWGLDTTPIGGGLDWWLWFNSNGQEGQEPPTEYLEQMERIESFRQSERGSDAYLTVGQEIVDHTVEEMVNIGTTGEAPVVAIRSNRLENFPDQMLFSEHLKGGHSDQWFLNE